MLSGLMVKEGDKIGIISTARWIAEEDIEFADGIIKSWGLVPVYGKSIHARKDQFAGDDEIRSTDLQQFLDDPEIRAILCARGGYGTIRIIEDIDFTGFMKAPKWICGFSDITILHAHINDKLGIPTIHSTMPVNFLKNSVEALLTLKYALFGKTTDINLNPHPLNITGDAEGEIIGGNLSILYSLLGTKFGFSTGDKILFIEDVDEYLYHIDRMMMSLKLAGKLQKLKGLIVGGMSDMKDNLIPFGKTTEEIILEHVGDLNIPVCFGFPAGHIDDNRAMILKRKIKLEVSAAGSSIHYLQK